MVTGSAAAASLTTASPSDAALKLQKGARGANVFVEPPGRSIIYKEGYLKADANLPEASLCAVAPLVLTTEIANMCLDGWTRDQADVQAACTRRDGRMVRAENHLENNESLFKQTGSLHLQRAQFYGFAAFSCGKA